MSSLLVVGLGNPGREYDGTRHNVGFAVLDALARALGLAWERSRRFEADLARGEIAPGRTALLAKPLTFMNESGRAVQSLASFHRVPPANTIAVYDDLNIALSFVKVSVTGSAGGHNGVASLLAHLGDGITVLSSHDLLASVLRDRGLDLSVHFPAIPTATTLRRT